MTFLNNIGLKPLTFNDRAAMCCPLCGNGELQLHAAGMDAAKEAVLNFFCLACRGRAELETWHRLEGEARLGWRRVKAIGESEWRDAAAEVVTGRPW
jgi:hypothetical protein